MKNFSNSGMCPDDKKHIDCTIPVRFGLKSSQLEVRLIIDDNDVDCIKVFMNGDRSDFKRNKKGNFEPIHLSKEMEPEVLHAIGLQLTSMFG